jgi:hypothetical protein
MLGDNVMSLIYRAVSKTKEVKNKLFVPHSTMRPPGNVPYIVDNLWEWARPRCLSSKLSPKLNLFFCSNFL